MSRGSPKQAEPMTLHVSQAHLLKRQLEQGELNAMNRTSKYQPGYSEAELASYSIGGIKRNDESRVI